MLYSKKMLLHRREELKKIQKYPFSLTEQKFGFVSFM